ncbi:hypothetical protein [Massilia sp. erpn]|uniref:hypothetical protein n=1 Tax=Massilia sp. erpn TaxID=2738142 RepID=UPI0021043F93|nr:hypothetical protein [Massilia sp. erpn]UTY60389.1 hypothetical protein HPQ68_26275 [Massilia sp. erpn]
MKTTIFAALLGLTLAGCASTGNQEEAGRNFEDSYVPTGSHIARKTVDRDGVQTVNKEEFRRSIENNPMTTGPGRQ